MLKSGVTSLALLCSLFLHMSPATAEELPRAQEPLIAKETSKEKTMTLNTKQKSMIPIAAFTSTGNLEKLKLAFESALDAGLTVNEAKEIPVHLYAYVGFPRSLNGLGALMTVLEERKARGIKDEQGPEPSPLPEDWDSLEQGTKVQTQLSGSPVEGPLFDFAPVANEYLRSHLFGDIFARDVLSYQDREVVTVAALSSLEGVEPQLKAHMNISMNAGLTEKALRNIVTVLRSEVGEPEAQRAQDALAQHLEKK